MSRNKIPLTPCIAWILHRRPFKETSAICELFTEDLGRISAILPNYKSKKKRTLMSPFQPLWIQLQGQGELKKIKQIESHLSLPQLMGHRNFCGLYLNELLLKSLPKGESVPQIFAAYQDSLKQLSDISINQEIILRNFELILLDALGYGLPFEQLDATTADLFIFCTENGFVPCQRHQEFSFTKASLNAIKNRAWHMPGVLKSARILMRLAMPAAIHHKTIQCRQLWQAVTS